MNQCSRLTSDELNLRTTLKGVPVEGHFSYLDFDIFEIMIDSPFQGIREGQMHDLHIVPLTVWYVVGGKIQADCLKQAKSVLRGIVEACWIVESKKEEFRGVVKEAISGTLPGYPGTTTADITGEKGERSADATFSFLNSLSRLCYRRLGLSASRSVLQGLLKEFLGMEVDYRDPFTERIRLNRKPGFVSG